MKSKKFKVSGLLVVLFLISISVVAAATALTCETFSSRMEAKGYYVSKARDGFLTAIPSGSTGEAYAFYEYYSDSAAQTDRSDGQADSGEGLRCMP